jgi:two-component system chemotaxis response regulator CheB
VERIKQAQGYCLTQSKETCVVYGMPKAVDDAKLSNESVPLEQLAERIKSLTGARP